MNTVLLVLFFESEKSFIKLDLKTIIENPGDSYLTLLIFLELASSNANLSENILPKHELM